MAKRTSKSDPVKASDPRKNLASTANKNKSYETESKSGKFHSSSKSVNDAREGKGQYSKPVEYKGSSSKAGVKTHDGSFTRATNPVDRKKAEAKLAYDKKLQEHKSKIKSKRNENMANSKPKGT